MQKQKQKKSRKLPKIISREELIKFISCISLKCPTGIRNYAIITIIYRSGLRVSEVCNLTLSDIDFENGLINIQQGKGNKDRYTVLDNTAAETLKKWIEIRPDSIYLFCTLKGGQLDTRYIREVCYRLSEKSGVYIQDGKEKKPVRPHTLRHFFATQALNDMDMNLREVQEMLGHSNLSTTQVYTHVQPKELAKKYRQRSEFFEEVQQQCS